MRTKTKKVYINGKFLAQSLTGVQRYSQEILIALDKHLGSEIPLMNVDFIILIPSKRKLALPNFKNIKILEISCVNLFVWEQILLPWVTRGAMLINLSGSAPLLKIHQICTFHDAAVFDMPESFNKLFVLWYKFLFTIQARLSLRIFTVSEFSRCQLSKHLKISNQKFDVIYCGADHIKNATESIGISSVNLESDKYFLALGSANPNKNFDRLAEAFSGIKDDVKLVVVGGVNSTVFTSSSSIRENDSRIIYTGRLDDVEVVKLYKHAHAFIFPSIYEGFGIPPVEAMLCGCPVLASSAASIPEICGDAVIYFDPYSVENIRSTMLKALIDSKELSNFRLIGLERARNFTWANASLKMLNVLKKNNIL